MSDADFDFSELNQFAVDIDGMLDRFPEGTKQVVSKGALEIKRAWKSETSASVQEARAFGSTIDYETTATRDVISAEIGPREGGSGSFAFLVFGNDKNGPVLQDPVIYARNEGEVVAGYLTELVEKALGA